MRIRASNHEAHVTADLVLVIGLCFEPLARRYENGVAVEVGRLPEVLQQTSGHPVVDGAADDYEVMIPFGGGKSSDMRSRASAPV